MLKLFTFPGCLATALQSDGSKMSLHSGASICGICLGTCVGIEVFMSCSLLGVSDGCAEYFAYISRDTCSVSSQSAGSRNIQGLLRHSARLVWRESLWQAQPKKQCLPSSGTAGEVSQSWPARTILGRSLTCLGQSRQRWAHPPFWKHYFSCWVDTNKPRNFLMAKLGMCSKIANSLQILQKTPREFTKVTCTVCCSSLHTAL